MVGGGPGAALALRKHFKAAVEDVGKPKPLVAYVGVASDDNVGFQKMITAELSLTGARFKPVKLASPKASVAEARELLSEADLVFVSGGDVDRGMQILKERDVLGHFRKLCKEGKPMFGISAGSVMLAQDWVRFPDDDDEKAEIFECIGAVPFHVDAHSESDDWSELRTLLRLLHKRGDKSPVGYGLTVKGAVSVEVDGEGALLQAMGTDIPKLVVKDCVVSHAAPLKLDAGRERVKHVAPAAAGPSARTS